jgi:hypothetical protein
MVGWTNEQAGIKETVEKSIEARDFIIRETSRETQAKVWQR